jgi:hypothetical protein
MFSEVQVLKMQPINALNRLKRKRMTMKRAVIAFILILSFFSAKVAGQPCTADISPGNISICYNTDPGTFTATGGGGTAYTYLWYKNGTSTSVTTQTYEPGNLTSTSTFYCEITSGECGTVTTPTTTITVYDQLTAGISGGTSPICYNTSPGTLTATGSGGTGLYTYLWYLNGSSTGVTTQTYNPNLTADADIYCAVTSGPCGPVNTSTVSITVYPELTASISGGTSPICYGDNPGTLTATPGGGEGTYTYLWYEDEASTGITTQDYSPGSLTVTTDYYCEVTDGSCGTVTTSTKEITVYDNLTAGISGGTSPICSGNSPGTFIATGNGGTGSYTYLWYMDGGPTGVTTQTYDPGSLTADAEFYCEVTSGSCGTVATSTFSVTVVPPLTAGISGGTSPICYNTSPGTFTATGSGGTGSYTYLWYKNGSSTGVATQTYDPGNLTSSSSFYCAITSGPCGPVNTSTTNITVYSLLTASISGSTEVCKNEPAPDITFTNPQSIAVTITYNINGSPTTINVSASSTSTVSAPTDIAGTFVYTLVSIEYQVAPFCTNTITGSATVEVHELPVPTIFGPDRACITSTGNKYLTEGSMTSYNWSVSSYGTIESGGGSSDNSVTVRWDDSGPETIRVNYIDANGCTAPSQTIYDVTVIDKPLPTNVQISGILREYATLTASYNYDQDVCYAEDLSLTEISWYRANNSSGSSAHLITTKPGTDKTLVLSSTEYDKYIQVRVKLSDGTTLMSPVSSTGWIGPVIANEKPQASGVSITGTLKVNNLLTGNYTYSDAESDPEGATAFQWYRADNGSGSGAVPITGATSQTYTLTLNDRDKYIRFGVTPKAQNGTTPGDMTYSSWDGPITDNPPVASVVTISGDVRVSKVLNGNYQYSDSEGDTEGLSLYQWHTGTNSSGAGSVDIVGATSASYQLTNDEIGKYIGFSVTPVAQAGSSPGTTVTTVTWVGPVINDPPVATIQPITGSLNVNGLLTGHYIYSDVEGDIESGTLYQWYSSTSAGGTYTPISGETNIAHIITNDEQGRYFKIYITPVAASGTTTGTQVISTASGPANSQPAASNVQIISGIAAVGSTLEGDYDFSDVDPADLEGISTFRWLRNSIIPITGAAAKTYLVTPEDEGYRLSFEVTPVSLTGYPNTGTPVQSALTDFVVDTSSLRPVASQVCIEGIRAAGQVLRGKYYYSFYKSEGVSTYQWYRNGIAIPGATGIQYTLQQVEDIDSNADITFKVTPRSSNIPEKVGVPVMSNPLARIIMPKDQYSVSENDVALSANVLGGVFSGTGVTDTIFSPSTAGSEGSPYTISYLLMVVNTAHNCSQQASKLVYVNPNVSSFVGFDTLYCHDSGTDVITVTGVPDGSTIIGFTCTDDNGIVSQSGTTVTIDPGMMSPEIDEDILFFSYNYLGTFYQISKSFRIDSVGTEIRILNLNSAYCQDDPKEYISIEGIYPLGGTATWTGDILSDTKAGSAYADPSLGTAGVSYPVSYRYRSPRGCYSKILYDTVTINPLPDPSFPLNTTYNITGGAVDLIPVQSGGTFSGNGVSGDKMFPDIAGLGEHEIKYIITDANSCTASLGLKTRIREAQGNFIDIPSVICYEDTTYNVKIIDLPSTGVTITGFTNFKNTLGYITGDTDADYNVPEAGEGLDTLVFSYKWDGVDYSISKAINVDSLGQVEIKNLDPGEIICDHVAPYELYTSVPGGVFTGPVSGGYIDPKKAARSDTVTYTYTNIKTGCSISTTVPVTVYPSPKVDFLPEDVCIENDSDTTIFINNTTPSDSIKSWQWVFTDGAEITTDTVKVGRYLYKTGGLQKIALTATTVNNCSVTKEATFNLGIRPDADFYWKNDCMHPDDSIILIDTTFSSSPVVSRSWRLFNGDEFSTAEKTARYLKADTGYLSIQYIVRTGYLNCIDTVTKNIYIRPTITIQADGYFEDFDAGKGGWVKDESTINNWSFGTPDREVITTASSGLNAWYTKFDYDHPEVESSSIISPCFDFSAAERPIIKLKLWRRFEKERDGATLQYKIGDNKEWQHIGTIGDGIQWFNSAVIRGEPGGSQLGWTTIGNPDNVWVTAIHTLDELKDQTDVKLRMAYGSDGSSFKRDGIAFDDIRIGDRNRNVLLEHFTNISDDLSSNANALVKLITDNKKEDVINIQYHTNFPGADPYFNDNPADASARILFYGLTRAPYTFIDGGTKIDFANIFDNDLVKIDSNDITKRSLIPSIFEISLAADTSRGILSVSGTITATEDYDSDNLTLYIAVTEKENSENSGANGETTFYNVFRKFIPDAGGISLQKTWTKDVPYTIPDQTWFIEKISKSSDIEVVAFIQNNITKELYQATSVVKQEISVGIEDLFGGKGNDFALYPNPALNPLTITFKEPLTHEADIRIYDFRGVVISSYKAGSGITEFFIDDLNLKGGIYLVRIVSGIEDLGYKKLVISGN